MSFANKITAKSKKLPGGKIIVAIVILLSLVFNSRMILNFGKHSSIQQELTLTQKALTDSEPATQTNPTSLTLPSQAPDQATGVKTLPPQINAIHNVKGTDSKDREGD